MASIMRGVIAFESVRMASREDCDSKGRRLNTDGFSFEGTSRDSKREGSESSRGGADLKRFSSSFSPHFHRA